MYELEVTPLGSDSKQINGLECQFLRGRNLITTQPAHKTPAVKSLDTASSQQYALLSLGKGQ